MPVSFPVVAYKHQLEVIHTAKENFIKYKERLAVVRALKEKQHQEIAGLVPLLLNPITQVFIFLHYFCKLSFYSRDKLSNSLRPVFNGTRIGITKQLINGTKTFTIKCIRFVLTIRLRLLLLP